MHSASIDFVHPITKEHMHFECELPKYFKEFLDIGLGDPHPLVGNLDNLYGIKINKNYRLIVEPLSDKLDDESLKSVKKLI